MGWFGGVPVVGALLRGTGAAARLAVASVAGLAAAGLVLTAMLGTGVAGAQVLPPGTDSDCDNQVPVVVASDEAAQSDLYSAATLAEVLGTSCVVLAGARDRPMPASQRARLYAADTGGWVVGGEAAVRQAKIAGYELKRLNGVDRWHTARLVGAVAGDPEGDIAALTAATAPAPGDSGGTTVRVNGRQVRLPPGIDSDCDNQVPVVVAADAAAQADLYSAVTLAGVLDTTCIVLAGARGAPIPTDQRARLDDADAESGWVVGGTAAVSDAKIAGRNLERQGGNDRWATARLIGSTANLAASVRADCSPNSPEALQAMINSRRVARVVAPGVLALGALAGCGTADDTSADAERETASERTRSTTRSTARSGRRQPTTSVIVTDRLGMLPGENGGSAAGRTPGASEQHGITLVPEITQFFSNNRTFEVAQIEPDPELRDGELTSALRGDRTSTLFPKALVNLADIRSGGPPPDGIPSIDEPLFQAVADVDWLEPQEAVIAVTIDGDARAYPTRILISHEIVNDTVGGTGVTVTYCPLCNSAVTYERAVGDRVLDFGTSGELYNSALVMYDRQTESLWAHYTGRAIVGTLAGTELELVPTATVSWKTFAASNPDGIVLARESGGGRTYGRNPYTGYDSPGGGPFFPASGQTDDRLPPQTRVLLVRHNGDAAVIETSELAERGVAHFSVGGSDVVAFWLAGTATPVEARRVSNGRDVGATGVFVSQLDGQVLTFEPVTGSDDERGAFTDHQSGSTWTLLGAAVDGSFAGRQLTAVEHLDTFWFAAASYSPDVELLELS